VSWKLVYTKQAQKDAKKLASTGLRKKAQELLRVIEQNPYQNPPPSEKLVGDLAGAYSRRINIQHRLWFNAGADDTVRTTCFDGLWPDAPHRALRNSTYERWQAASSTGEP